MKFRSLITAAVTGSILLTSCLKSHNNQDILSDNGSIVTEIADVNIYGNLKFVSLDLVPATETITLATLKFAAPRNNKPGASIHVVLTLDPSAVTAAGLTPLPSNGYTLSSLEWDIPADSRQIDIPITIFKNNLNLANSYGIGFHIATVSQGVISELAKDIVVGIGLKNRWDGRYLMHGTFVDFSNAAFTYYGDQHYSVITTGPTQVKVLNEDLNGGTYGYLFLNGSSGSFYGSFGLVINFDATTNAITSVVNYYGQPSANGRSATLDPSGLNKWNPATKAIDIKYWMDQPSVITPHRAAFNEHWTYLGSR
jgi:hypothetical protein